MHDQLASMDPRFAARVAVRPGITGLAQVEYHYAGSVLESFAKLDYDLEYLRTIGLRTDVIIGLRTAWYCLMKFGSAFLPRNWPRVGRPR